MGNVHQVLFSMQDWTSQDTLSARQLLHACTWRALRAWAVTTRLAQQEYDRGVAMHGLLQSAILAAQHGTHARQLSFAAAPAGGAAGRLPQDCLQQVLVIADEFAAPRSAQAQAAAGLQPCVPHLLLGQVRASHILRTQMSILSNVLCSMCTKCYERGAKRWSAPPLQHYKQTSRAIPVRMCSMPEQFTL